MKLSLILVMGLFFSFNIYADVYVKGHYRSNGTWVRPHYRSNPNSIKSDNWSTQGNTNPYTGKVGTEKINNYNYGRGSHNIKRPYSVRPWGGH